MVTIKLWGMGLSLRLKQSIFTPSATQFTPSNGLYMHVKHRERVTFWKCGLFTPPGKSLKKTLWGGGWDLNQGGLILLSHPQASPQISDHKHWPVACRNTIPSHWPWETRTPFIEQSYFGTFFTDLSYFGNFVTGRCILRPTFFYWSTINYPFTDTFSFYQKCNYFILCNLKNTMDILKPKSPSY